MTRRGLFGLVATAIAGRKHAPAVRDGVKLFSYSNRLGPEAVLTREALQAAIDDLSQMYLHPRRILLESTPEGSFSYCRQQYLAAFFIPRRTAAARGDGTAPLKT